MTYALLALAAVALLVAWRARRRVKRQATSGMTHLG